MPNKCYMCGIGNMERKNGVGLAHQLQELADGRFICDGECDTIMLLQILKAEKEKRKTKKPKKLKLLPKRPNWIDEWLGDDDRKIVMYRNRYESTIWNYYDKKKFWLKHKGDAGFLIIECKEGDLSQHDYDQFRKEKGWQ